MKVISRQVYLHLFSSHHFENVSFEVLFFVGDEEVVATQGSFTFLPHLVRKSLSLQS